MQNPAVYRASVLVLVLLVVLVKTSTTVEAADQHDRVCIRPKANGDYNIAYNKAGLPVSNPLQVQDSVLRIIRTQVTNGFTQGLVEFCSRRNAYTGDAGDSIDLFNYAYCGQGVDRQGCSDCLARGAEVIKESCGGNGCFGAQASSDDCCIRFEGVPFCTFVREP